MCHVLADSWVLQREQSLESVFGNRLRIHREESEQTLLTNLERHGLSRESLPKCIGGAWDVSQLAEWQGVRIRNELDLPPMRGHKAATTRIDHQPGKRMSQLNDAERLERRRRLNTLHSRRKRQRNRIKVDTIKKQVTDLRDSNQSLFKDNKRLEGLVDAANTLIALTSSTPTQSCSIVPSHQPTTQNAGVVSSHPQPTVDLPASSCARASPATNSLPMSDHSCHLLQPSGLSCKR